MKTMTMERAREEFPNMVTVLTDCANALKEKVTKVLIHTDVWDAAEIYIDGDFEFKEFFAIMRANVPEDIVDAEIGCSMLLPMEMFRDDDRAYDVTNIAKEIWYGTE